MNSIPLNKTAKKMNHDLLTRIMDKWRIFSANKMALLGFCIIVSSMLVAVIGPLLLPYDPYTPDLNERMKPPSMSHWFGTDQLGRDILTRIIEGARTTFYVATGAVIIAFLIGTPLGALAGYFGRKLDAVIMRIMDALLAFPSRLLAISLVAFMGASVPALWAAIAIGSIPHYARIIRGEVLAHREKEYVQSARMSGEGHLMIIYREILPNCLPPLMIQLSLNFAEAILVESSLSYLGLGLAPPTISWGLMLRDGQNFMELMPWIAIFPGAAIAVFVLGFNLIGDGLRDAFDPRQRKR
ncbi:MULTISPECIES: ABC transporter permease [unclassified Paenibacillus]|uniref:ABC transporter permease n=1 Tax=unclassified Paenibacillus TaxID=185978 RepID=UPI001AE46D28|nr:MULTISPECIES: ABC transporter permease [unclassified Paenibacillus]MBP1156462.1 ABC-type dipeptide/oligopeptide/nickel transport system permease subunit [Paenibacillus sp. PvP091]MBP1168152.1 ABC-type dipeptide/oligopeptide/nickel transport system permease subunit [Paenibacillus sp. PvR098]MBP2439180.1 ABC-type dipeptide/oligopeptide/nickel transport system permease subunit [Paenibacillus sp. PvP052]